MVSQTFRYTGDLRCVAIHDPSGSMFHTDAPVDNQGKGESFSPTDLLLSALVTCIVTTAAIKARTLGVELVGTRATGFKTMSQGSPRRVEQLDVTIEFEGTQDQNVQRQIAEFAENCPVSRSLHPDVEVKVEIQWAKR